MILLVQWIDVGLYESYISLLITSDGTFACPTHRSPFRMADGE